MFVKSQIRCYYKGCEIGGEEMYHFIEFSQAKSYYDFIDKILEKSYTAIDIFKYIFGQMNPTMNFQSGEVAKFPVLYAPNMGVEALAMENVSISKEDWDSFETSWGFSHHPLILQQS